MKYLLSIMAVLAVFVVPSTAVAHPLKDFKPGEKLTVTGTVYDIFGQKKKVNKYTVVPVPVSRRHGGSVDGHIDNARQFICPRYGCKNFYHYWWRASNQMMSRWANPWGCGSGGCTARAQIETTLYHIGGGHQMGYHLWPYWW